MADESSATLRSTATTLESPFAPCVPCQQSGRCPQCGGLGRTGRLKNGVPAPDAKPCWRCKGYGLCWCCHGRKEFRRFHPHIYIDAVRRMPSSIAIAAMTGGGLRTYHIPARILDRSLERQRGWVSWWMQRYTRDRGGQSVFFGAITGYAWMPSPGMSIGFDVRGRLIGVSDWQLYNRLIEEAQ